MKIIDLTHTITEFISVYPGTEGPGLSTVSTYEEHGFKETLISMYSHTGTHMDAPQHIFKSGKSLDSFMVEQFVGKALVIDCSDLRSGDVITMDYINAVRSLADRAEFILFQTGWDCYWGTEAYFGDYPYITEEVAKYLIDSKKKGIGLDTIGLDPIADEGLNLHHIVLEKSDFVIIENLTGLSKVGNEIFTLCALPLKYENADGAPIRAIAIVEDELY